MVSQTSPEPVCQSMVDEDPECLAAPHLNPMAQPIQTLTPDLIHRIAAGEVIDSLSAVVRELIDNALDAKADRLNLVIWPNEWSVQLSDNGTGLSRDRLDCGSKAPFHQ